MAPNRSARSCIMNVVAFSLNAIIFSTKLLWEEENKKKYFKYNYSLFFSRLKMYQKPNLLQKFTRFKFCIKFWAQFWFLSEKPFISQGMNPSDKCLWSSQLTVQLPLIFASLSSYKIGSFKYLYSSFLDAASGNRDWSHFWDLLCKTRQDLNGLSPNWQLSMVLHLTMTWVTHKHYYQHKIALACSPLNQERK